MSSWINDRIQTLHVYGVDIDNEGRQLVLKDELQQMIEDNNLEDRFLPEIYYDTEEGWNMMPDIPKHVGLWYGPDNHCIVGIDITAPWDMPITSKFIADGMIQKALNMLFKDVPNKYASTYCEEINEYWLED